MLTKILGDVPGEVLRHLESEHGEVILRALRTRSDGLGARLGRIAHLKPNQLSDEEIQLVAQLS